MTALLIFLSIALIAILFVQIGKVTELRDRLYGEEESQYNINSANANFGLFFLVLFLVGCIWSMLHYKNYMLGYGPHQAASMHGGDVDWLFNTTTIVTGIVFFITQILLFWFAFKYRGRKGRKAVFMPHDTKLEIIWTTIPALVMAFLVIQGLMVWNNVMDDVKEGEEAIEIEATGMQFAWIMRYPGHDGVLGTRNYKLISPSNPLGQDWTDTKNLDDIVSSAPGEIIKIPKGKKIRVRITARDVLHSFFLPHFRVKMDAVPGMPTYFVFTPKFTTQEYREKLSRYPEYQVPSDPDEPDGPKAWETFQYELACAELCGKGHYSMRRIFEVVEPAEWERWMEEQKSYYLTAIRKTDDDPFKNQLLDIEIKQRAADFEAKVKSALDATEIDDKIIRLDYVNFKTGSAELTPNSKYELENVVSMLKTHPAIVIEIGGHTDNTGNPLSNESLSQSRADAVANFISSKGIGADRYTAVGYGQNKPIESNDTAEGRAQNRRTEFKIIKQ